MAKKSFLEAISSLSEPGSESKGGSFLQQFSQPKKESGRALTIDDLTRQNDSSRQKLSEAGYDDPTREVKPSMLERIFGPLDALGTGVRGLVYNAVSDENVDVWGEMGKALKGEDRVEGADIIEELGVDNKWGKMLGGFAVDMLLDPLTYLTLGYGAAAKAGGKGVLTAAAKYGDDAIDIAKFATDIGKNADEAADVLRVLKSNGLVDDAGRFLKGAISDLTREQSQRVMTDLYKQFGKGGVKFAGIGLGGEDAMSKLGYAVKGADVGGKATGLRAIPGAKTVEQVFGMGGIPSEYADLTREGNEVLNTVVKAMRSNVGRELKVNQRIAERFGRELTEAIPDETARTWASVAIGRQFGDDAPKLADLVDNARNLYGTDEFAGALDAVAEFRSGLLGRAKDNITTTLRKTAGLSDEQVESALRGIDLYDSNLQRLYAGQKERGLLSLGVFGDDATGYLPGVSTPEMTDAARDVAGKLGANVDTLRDQTKETLPFLKRGRNVEATQRKDFLTLEDRLLGRPRGLDAVPTPSVSRADNVAMSVDDIPGSTMYHGSPMGEIKQLDVFASKPLTPEGPGAFLTQDPSIAAEYALGRTAKRGSNIADGAVSKFKISDTARVLDQDSPLPADALESLRLAFDDIAEEFDEGDTFLTAFKKIKGWSADERVPAWEVQDRLLSALSDDYDVLTHLEGKIRGIPHRVTQVINDDVLTPLGRAMDEVASPLNVSINDVLKPKPASGNGLKTELDLSKLGTTAQSKQGGRIILKDFENELAQTLGNNEVATKMAKSLEGFFTDDDATKNVLRTFDKVTNWWKRQATVMRFPAFSNRNFMSNKVLMAQNGGLSVAGEAKSVEVLTKMAKYNAGKLDDVARKAFEQEIDEYVRHGVLTSFEELAEQVGKSTPTKVTKALGTVNEFVENQGRISAYHTFLKKGMGAQAAGEMVNKTLFDYSDEVLSVFERNVIKRLTPFYKWCVPSDSEILTREGFKLYNDLRVGDDVLTYSLELDSMEWQPVQEIATFDVDEDIHVFSNKRVKLRYTDGHRWVTQRRNSTVRHTYGTYRYGGEIRVKTAEQINTDDLLLITSEYHGRASVLTPDQARLLGWLVTDGYHRWRGKHLECVLYQSPKKVCFDEVVAVAGGRPRKPHPITGVVCIPILRELVNELKPHFASKDDLPAIVGGLSREAAEAMYDAMLKAEGSVVRRGTNREHTAFTQKPGPVLDSFLMLCALTGRSVSVRERNGISTVIVRKRRVLSVAAGKQERERYTGIVWCPVTPNGTWVMRQDGSVVITGNTKNNLSNQTRILLESPGKSTWLGHIMESGGAAADIDTSNMPEWLRELNPIQTPLMFRGNPVMISTEGLFPQNDLELIGKVVTGEMNANDALSFLNPLLRTPLEIIMNKDVYYDEDLQSYEGEKKRAPGYVEEFGDIANAVPGLREAWGLMTNALGIQERTGKDGEDYYWMDARANKVLKDALPWMNQVAKYVGGADPGKTVLDRWSATGVKSIKYDTEQFEQNKAYEDRDALMEALALMRDESTAKPGLTLQDLFGGR